MTQQLLVSVIIPTYNRERYIKKAIDSVLNQTYQNIEIIIMDGSPNNKTEEGIKPYLSNPRVFYFHQEDSHKGCGEDRSNIAKARNKAINFSKGKYIAILDDDDEWCDEKKLEKQIEFLENHPDYVACGGGVIKIQEGNSKRPFIFDPFPPERDEDIKKEILFNWGICTHSTLVFRKDVGWGKAGGYSIQNPYNEDCEFVFRLAKLGKVYNFQEYFTYFLIGKQNKPIWQKLGRKRIKANIQLVKKYRHNYPGYRKAILWAWILYFYSFLPLGLQGFIRPVASKIKKLILEPFISEISKSR